MANLENNDLVTLSNSLITADFRLTLNEIRLLFIAMSQMPKGNDNDNTPLDPMKPYYITKQDFMKFDVTANNVANDIRLACRDLFKREVFIDTPLGVKNTRWVHNILHFKSEIFEELKRKYPTANYDDEFIESLRFHNLMDSLPFINSDNDDVVARVIFHPDIIPYISKLKEAFTQLEIDDLAGFSSFYGFRVYMLMMAWRKTGFVIIKLDDFRKMLVLVDKYSSVQNLKKRVLDMAIKDINTNSPYYSEYKLTDKSGRSGKGIKLTHLKIKFKKKSVVDGESKDKTSKQSTPPPETEMITSNDDLTEAQKQALASVNKYIADNKIDDKKHIENLKRKALKDSWNMKTKQSTIIPSSKFSEPLSQDDLKFKGMKK